MLKFTQNISDNQQNILIHTLVILRANSQQFYSCVTYLENSDGDLQMLQWTAAGGVIRLMLYVHHTDAEREWAYDRDSHIGRLNKGLDEATEKGWVVVNMKKDWNKIYPD